MPTNQPDGGYDPFRSANSEGPYQARDDMWAREEANKHSGGGTELIQPLTDPTYTVQNGIKFSDETEGASDYSACKTRHAPGGTCRCQPRCIVCGWGEHSGLHGPVYGEPVGSKPWAHKFQPPKPVTKAGHPKRRDDMSTITVEFAFDIGDIVYYRASNHDHGSCPKQFVIYERMAQQCHADMQRMYRIFGVEPWVSEVVLSKEEPPMRIRSDESIAEEQRVAALSADIRQAADDIRWEASQARRAARKAKDRQEESEDTDGNSNRS